MPQPSQPVYVCDPETFAIVHRCKSQYSASKVLEVSRQAIYDALQTQHRVKGFLIVTPDAYSQLKEASHEPNQDDLLALRS